MLDPFRRRVIIAAGLAVITAGLTVAAHAQPGSAEDKKIDARSQSEAIDSIAVELNRTYVFPDVAKKMVKLMRDQYKKKAYAPITSTRDFAQKLTEDLQSVSHDKHLSVDYLSDQELSLMTGDGSGRTADEEALHQERRSNFGFRETRMLPGNVGYLRLDGFSNANEAGATAAAAMNFLANADAVIFDLRQNGGGSPKMIQLLCNYLFDRPVHLNDFYIRRSDNTEQFWTQPQVTGRRMSTADVFVLTSRRTFSAAEEFTYDLKNLNRATVVGDTTGGGAHPVDSFYWANVHLSATIPFGRAINPVTKTNWEGTGVAPDIIVESASALDAAHREALKKIVARTTDEQDKAQLNWTIAGLDAKLNPPNVDVTTLSRYAGDYGPRAIKLDNGALFYRRAQNPWARLTPMSSTLFQPDNIDYFRLEVVLDTQGNPIALVGHYDNGTVDRSERTAKQ